LKSKLTWQPLQFGPHAPVFFSYASDSLLTNPSVSTVVHPSKFMICDWKVSFGKQAS